MYPDTELDFGDVKIRALYGRHVPLMSGAGINDVVNRIVSNRDLCRWDKAMADLQKIGTFEYRNYLFTTPNGTKILLWGNMPTVEQVNLCKSLKPDIAIIQRSVGTEMKEKAKFAADIGCKVLIPHHHDFHCVDDPADVELMKNEFLSLVPDGKFITVKHGEWVEL